MRGNAHAGFGERPAEADRWQHRHRAAGRLTHPGAQLRFDDVEGMRITAFATNARTGQLPDLELRHRRRARVEDRIRIAKDTGLANLPLQSFAANRIWCAIVALAGDLTAWMGLLALHGHDARRWEPKKLRYRLFTIPATLARSSSRLRLHLATRAPFAKLTLAGLARLGALAPGARRSSCSSIPPALLRRRHGVAHP